MPAHCLDPEGTAPIRCYHHVSQCAEPLTAARVTACNYFCLGLSGSCKAVCKQGLRNPSFLGPFTNHRLREQRGSVPETRRKTQDRRDLAGAPTCLLPPSRLPGTSIWPTMSICKNSQLTRNTPTTTGYTQSTGRKRLS